MSRTSLVALGALMFLVSSHGAFADDPVRVTWRNGRTAELREDAMQKYRRSPVPIELPKKAIAQKLAGKGLFEAEIDRSGKVAAVRIRQSTGSKILDQAAIKALRKARYQPGIFASVIEPVSFQHFREIRMRF